MNVGFFISGIAGQMQQNKLDGLSHNLANVNTVGYREDRTAFSSQFSSMIGREGQPEQTSASSLSLNKQYISTQPGTIQQTGNESDFAIQGNGYFRVQLENGSEALTRAGNLKLGPDGALLTQSNLPVLDNGGSPITLPVGAISSTKDGTIYVDDQAVSQFGIASIIDERRIQKLEGVLIQTPADNIAAADDSVSIHNGAVEGSNVNSILAMAELVECMRGYESMMKVVEQYNQQAGLLSDRVGVVQG